MTRLPDHVLIGPYRYSIHLTQQVKPKAEGRIGRIMFRKLRIEISNRVSVETPAGDAFTRDSAWIVGDGGSTGW